MTKSSKTSFIVIAAGISAAVLLVSVGIYSSTHHAAVPRSAPDSPPDAAQQSTSAEEARALEVPRVRIMDVSDIPALHGETTRVTVDCDGAAPDAVLGTLAPNPSSHFRFVPPIRPDAPSLNMHLHNVPLAHAVAEIAVQSHAYVGAWTPTQLTLMNSEDVHSSFCIAGPVAIQFVGLQTWSGNRLLPLNILADPKMVVTTWPETAVIDTFTDSNGNTIHVIPYADAKAPVATSTSLRTAGIYFTHPDPPADAIAVVRGHVTLMLGATPETLQTSDVDETLKRNVRGLEVEILPMTITERDVGERTLTRYSVQIRYRQGKVSADAWATLVKTLRNTRPFPLDAEGNAMQAPAFATQTTAPDGAELLQFNYAGPGVEGPPPTHLKLTLNPGTTAVQVPFEFNGIPLGPPPATRPLAAPAQPQPAPTELP